MAKQQADGSNRFSVFFLKKHGYFNKDWTHMSGGITWTYGYSERKNNISFTVIKENWNTPQEQAHINLRYTQTDSWSGEKSEMDFNVQLTTTPCKYGGKRYWFICPLYKNGQYCGKRVGVIFSIGKWFGCRHCGNIAYASQMRGGKYRGSSITCPDIDKLEQEMKRWYYRGQPTKKHKRLIRMNEKLNNAFMLMAARFGHKDFGSLLDDTGRLQEN